MQGLKSVTKSLEGQSSKEIYGFFVSYIKKFNLLNVLNVSYIVR